MKSKFRFYKSLMWLTAIAALLSFSTIEVQATHFRYGHLTWQKLQGNTARFTLTNAFRRDGYFGTAGDGFPAVGDIITETIGTTVLNFGDFTQTSVLQYRVKAIDITNNWLLAVALENAQLLPNKESIDHTYAAATGPGGAPWLAEINSCCRTSVEQNNPDDDYQVSTLVELTSGNRSPVSSLPAIVNVAQSATSQFIVPGADADPNTVLTFRLATADEAGTGFNQPALLSIDPLTGLVTWNSLGAVIGGLYSCQVIIEDRTASSTAPVKTRVAVDFLIYVTPQVFPCDVNVAPTFNAPPTPANGSVFNVQEGQNTAFTVTASDADAGNVVTLNSAGIPVGATLSTGLPADGNPISTNFSWTPSIGQAGAYVVTFSATDSCGLQALVSYTINVTPAPLNCNLRLSISNTKASCFGACDGTLTANPSSGQAPYSYLWSNGQTTKTAVGLCKGPYTVTVTDNKGCTITKSCSVGSPSQINIGFVCVNVKCKGECTGSITANPSGGSGTGYTYNWSNGQTTKTISGLCAGIYTVTVTDSKGCTRTLSKTVTEPAKVLAVTVGKTACSVCLPNCNGTATANQTGGVSPYTYLWSNGQTTKKILYLCAGIYTVTVTDKNGCTTVGQTTIVGNCCVLAINPTINPNTNCAPCNGSISVAPTGGSGSYHYAWSNGSTASSITGLCSGPYTVTVYDNQSASCTATATYNVTDNVSTVNANCSVTADESGPGNNDGALDGSATGGTGSYTYAWSNGQTTEDISGLTAGTYTLVVLDANGCSSTTSCSIITLEEDECDGDFTTYTQGGWGNTGAPGNYMAANFENCFGSVVIGDACGFTITLTDSNEVREFLPQGSGAAALTQSYVDPGSANITVLAGQVLGVVFALGYDDCDPDFGGSPTDLGLQVYNKPGHPWNGWNIQQIANESNRILAGCASLYTPGDANTACTDINENYDEGVNNGLFYCPGVVRFADAGSTGLTNVYPNPFSESLTVKFNSNEVFSVTITDVTGRVLGVYNGGMNEMQIGQSLHAGIYMITVTTESGYQSVTRVMKGK